MKHFSAKAIVCCAVALAAAYWLPAEETTVSSAKDFRRAVENNRYDVINISRDFSIDRSLSITRDIKIRSSSSSVKTISNKNSFTITVAAGAILELTNIVFSGSSNYPNKADVFHLSKKDSSGRIAKMCLLSGATIKDFTMTTGANADHAVIHVKEGARFVLNDGAAILNCKNKSEHGNGGAICCDFGNVVINGGTIAGSSAKGAGGAIRSTGERIAAEDNVGLAMRGDIYLYGGYITNNVCGDGAAEDAEAYGGGIYLGGSGPMLHVIGPAVVSNNVCKAGGKTVADDVSTFRLHDDFANRLKLSMNESDLMFTNGWIGVRYPDAASVVDPQSKRFGAVWEYVTRHQDEARQFFWNGDNTYRGWMSKNSLVWSRYHMHELPRDDIRITTLLNDADHAGPIYVELTDDYEMLMGENDHAKVPDGRQLIIDLQGYDLKCDLHVMPGGQITILDSSTNRAGKVHGHRVFEGEVGTVAWTNAFVLQGGSYHDQPPPAWIAPDRVLIGNYCNEHPWMVARVAWETNLVSRLEDVTKVPLETVDEEVRVVEMTGEGESRKPNIGKIVFSSGDWRRVVPDIENLKAEIFAAPAVRNGDGSLEECGARVLIYRTGAATETGSALGNEDAFEWARAASVSGLIKLIHITTKTVGATVTTNAVETAYFQFPEAAFEATQRKAGEGKLPITIVESLLASLGYNRDQGFDQDDVNTNLDTKQDNGLRKWENIVTGTDENQLLLSTASNSGEGFSLNIALSDAGKEARTDTGYTVKYDIRKSTPSGWARIGEVKDDPSFSIDLLSQDGSSVGASGFYRVTTLIIPNDKLSVTNEIPSTNIVGVLEVASKLKNTLAAVPWVSLAADPAKAGAVRVSDYVHTAHLSNNDAVQVADKGYIYRMWKWNETGNQQWDEATTVTTGGASLAPKASEHQLSRNSAVWVTRAATNKPFFLIGQYAAGAQKLTIEAGAAKAPVCTLVPNPSLEDVEVNSSVWGWMEYPHKDDLIRIPTGNGIPLVLRWKYGSWGRWVYNPTTESSEWKTDQKIPAGTGFFYQRCGTTSFELTLPTSSPAGE